MRIAINGWFCGRLATGSGQYFEALTEWLSRVGEGCEFLIVKPEGIRGFQQVRRRRPVTGGWLIRSFTETLVHPFVKLWFEQVTFPLACRRLHADVAFVPYWGAPWWRPCPVVVTVHDLIPLLLPLYRGGLLQRVYTALVSRTARRAAAVLTDSEASKRDIITHLGIPADRIHAIQLAVDPRYRPVTDPAELARVRVKYSLSDAPVLLYLGGFDARKNVGRMIEAYARMARRWTIDHRPSTTEHRLSSIVNGPPALVIAGKLPTSDTSFTPDPRPVAARLGVDDCVHFIGWVDEADKPALYSLALATVFVSEYEGFGLPVLEAMACEKIRSAE